MDGLSGLMRTTNDLRFSLLPGSFLVDLMA